MNLFPQTAILVALMPPSTCENTVPFRGNVRKCGNQDTVPHPRPVVQNTQRWWMMYVAKRYCRFIEQAGTKALASNICHLAHENLPSRPFCTSGRFASGHDLRRTFATTFENLKVPDYSISTTQTYYRRHDAEAVNAHIEKIQEDCDR